MQIKRPTVSFETLYVIPFLSLVDFWLDFQKFLSNFIDLVNHLSVVEEFIWDILSYNKSLVKVLIK